MTKQRRTSIPIATLVLILATPVASWWLIGDLTNEEARQLAAEGVELDYAIPPVSLGPVGDRTVGFLACIGAVAALAWLAWATSSRRLDSRWWRVLLPLVGAGVLVGFAWRVLTAGAIGANIGAGLTIIIGGPILAVLLIAAAVAAPRRHQERQAAERFDADNWADPGLVFATAVGTPIHPRNDYRSFREIIRRAGLRQVRLHDLRHTAASVLLSQGVPARVVMEILGHSQISVTLNIYAHVAPEIAREAASRLEGALWSGE